jgi:hypothetical protein
MRYGSSLAAQRAIAAGQQLGSARHGGQPLAGFLARDPTALLDEVEQVIHVHVRAIIRADVRGKPIVSIWPPSPRGRLGHEALTVDGGQGLMTGHR